MAKNFRELEARMSPESRERSDELFRGMVSDMLLTEIRQQAGLTQEQLAASMGVEQSTISRMESQSDMQISTLRRIIEALGGELELIAHLPAGTIRITHHPPKAPGAS